MAGIHPTAIVAQGAQIAPSASVGPYCVIGAEVTLAEGVELKSHVCVEATLKLAKAPSSIPSLRLATRHKI